jgi:hypothetical protein
VDTGARLPAGNHLDGLAEGTPIERTPARCKPDAFPGINPPLARDKRLTRRVLLTRNPNIGYPIPPGPGT